MLIECWSDSTGSGTNRPRSKTFEEYEKETSDIWDDKEEDLEALTHSCELDMVPEAVAGSERGRGRTARPKGKGTPHVV